MRKHCVLAVSALALVVVLGPAVSGQTPDPLIGKWRVNVAKSTYSGPPPTFKSQISTWESVGGQLKNSTETVDAKGQTTRTEIMVKFDGTDIPVQGAAVPTTRAYKRIDARSFEFVQKENGKVTTTFRSVMAADGKTRTLTTTGTNAQGQAVKNVVLWEKQ